MRMRVEAASREFSRSSFTTEAGRSTTSPAAILLATCSGRTWILPMGQLAPAKWDPSLRSGFRLRAPAALTPANRLNVLGKDVDSTHVIDQCSVDSGQFGR